ncbi:MAG: exonuclease domain-containing protein [Lachnospiraceae bacterium]
MAGQNKGKSLMKYVPDYVVFDLETTGLSPIKDEIIELSALLVKNGSVTDTFSTLINPDRSIPASASRINGITNDMVAGAPSIRTVMSDFLVFSQSQILVGHNIKSFDLKFINCASEQLFGTTIDNDYIDTLYMSRSFLPKLRSHKLVDISAHFNINSEGAHRALNDCIMNQKCFEAMGRMQPAAPIVLCPRCSGQLQKRNGKFGQFWGCANYPVCRYTRNV